MTYRRMLGIDVLAAARKRITSTFDEFKRVCVAFSGGKDSTAMLHLVMDEAILRQRKVDLLFIDWEAQYKLTIDHVTRCFEKYADYIVPYWVALPLLTTNACSSIEPEWTCWEPGKEWVRHPPAIAITDHKALPFYKFPMTFEEFVPGFSRWLGDDSTTFVGIRTAESLNRLRTLERLARDAVDENSPLWRTRYSTYPIYDWTTKDIWTYFAQSKREYNGVYDLMHQAGLSLHKMRICEPYGDEQRQGLWLFHVLEPETWPKVVARVAGANTAALYANQSGNVMGNRTISRPAWHTWESFAKFLLDTLPRATSEHYRNKFSVWRRWYEVRGQQISDELPGDIGSVDMPSWRRLCKVLLRNDYWCKSIGFSPTKADSYSRYKKVMSRRRQTWGIAW